MEQVPLEAFELEQLAALGALRDEFIDTDDIPEAPQDNWKHARRPGSKGDDHGDVLVRLDPDVVAWFKAHTGPETLEPLINRVLRAFSAASREVHKV